MFQSAPLPSRVCNCHHLKGERRLHSFLWPKRQFPHSDQTTIEKTQEYLSHTSIKIQDIAKVQIFRYLVTSTTSDTLYDPNTNLHKFIDPLHDLVNRPLVAGAVLQTQL